MQVPKRSRRYGVGKDIGGALYVHRSVQDVLPSDTLRTAKSKLPAGYSYQVVKFHEKKGVFSFVRVPGFDTQSEPGIEETISVMPNGSVQRRSLGGNVIYHHKWLFVRDDYKGFDVEASKRRSAAIAALTGVNPLKIGRKRYWEEEVLPRLRTR